MAKAGRDHPIAQRIRAARAWADMSRDQVGARVGVGPATIGNWERGYWTTDGPNLSELEGIARATGVPSWFLLSGFEGAELLADDALDALAQSSSRAPDPSTPAKRPQ